MKKSLFFLVLVTILFFANTSIYSQKIFFDSAKSISAKTLVSPLDLKIGDLNGDGIADIVVASKDDNSVLYFEGMGTNGEFKTLKVITEDLDKAGIIILTDIDKDQDLDILAGSSRGQSIILFENLDGLGNFSLGTVISSTTDGLSALIADDIDNDGDIDILASFRRDKKIVYFENNGGVFSDENLIEETEIQVFDISFVDIDGDNKKDIIAGFGSNEIVWYKGLSGSGDFSERQVLISELNEPNSLMFTDIDEDGDKDLFCVTRGEIAWFNNSDGAGTFNDKKQILDYSHSTNDLIASDIDSDGDKDLVVGISEGNRIVWFENQDGAGNFSNIKNILFDFNGAYAIGVYDFDNNNTPDICATSYYLNRLILLKNSNGTGNFDAPIKIEESPLNEPQRMVSGDFNSDGNIDILIANQRYNNLMWYKNNNDGTFQHNIITEDDGAVDRIIAQGDLDGDGSSDIITSLAQGSFALLYWYKNMDGQGDFEQKSIQLKNYNNIVQIIPIDIDNDNDVDIILVSEEGNLISYLLNTDGEGKFGVQTVLTDQTNHPNFIHVNDFDQDGDNDIAVLSNLANSIYILKNNGQGNFDSPVKIMDTKNAPKSIISFDKDDDGDIDLVYSSQDQNSIYWIENIDGQGNFGPSMQLSNNYGYGPDIIIGSDLDLDGDIDLTSFIATYKVIDWQNNFDGMGYYSEAIELEKYLNGLEYILVADMNGDSYPDILTINSDVNTLTWYENLLAPSFTQNPEDIEVCDKDTIIFEVEVDFSDSLRWQVKKAFTNQFVNLEEDINYFGTNTKVLTIYTNGYQFNDNEYRCIAYYKGQEFYSEPALFNIYEFIESNAGNDNTTCDKSIWINGSNPYPGNGIWSVETGNATIMNISDFSSKAENLSNGINIFRWIVTNGICSDYDDVQIIKNDSLKIVNQPQNTEVYEGENATFEVNIDGDTNSFQWFKDQFPLEDGNNIAGAKTSKLLVNDATSLDAGIYYCDIQGICNFVKTDNAILTTITGIENLTNPIINIYPNPIKNQLFIQTNLDIDEVEIRGVDSKEILNISGNLNKEKIDITNLTNGIYIIKIKAQNKLITRKFVKI